MAEKVVQITTSYQYKDWMKHPDRLIFLQTYQAVYAKILEKFLYVQHI